MRVRWLNAWLSLALALGLVACAPLSRVTLLPDADGRSTAVQVQGASGAQQLDQPYAVAAVHRTGTVDRVQTTAEAVQQQFGALLSLQPPGAQRFVLQFEPGTATLTPDSQAQLPTILAQAQALPGGELVVVGHTDRTGSPQANDVLSLQRAQAV
ncbi:MAG: OmpA family protein, partial [Burkholderiaceae bacterium]|nr:OmpA family protein [Burkholderiaceae bacterium]